MNFKMNKYLINHIISLLLFGLNGIIASIIALSSYETVFYRTFFASILLVTVFLITKNNFSFLKHKKSVFCLIISGVSMGLSWMFLYEAFSQIGVSLASLIYYCGPVIVLAVSPIVFKERLTIKKIIGFSIVLIGIVLINGNVLNGSLKPFGVFCALMSAILYSSMVIFNKKAKQITGLNNTVLQMLISCFTVTTFIIIKQGFKLNINADNFLLILILGFINTGLGCYLYFSSISKLKVQTVTVCGYIEPLSAVLFSFIILKERMSILEIIGACFIIFGAIFSEISLKHKKIH